MVLGTGSNGALTFKCNMMRASLQLEMAGMCEFNSLKFMSCFRTRNALCSDGCLEQQSKGGIASESTGSPMIAS